MNVYDLLKHFKYSILFFVIFISGCTTMPTKEEIANLDYGSCPTGYKEKIKSHFEGGLLVAYSGDPIIWPPRKQWYKESPLKGGKLLAGYLVPVTANMTRGAPQLLGHREYGFLFKNGEVITKLEPLQMQYLNLYDAVGPIPKDDRKWKKGHSTVNKKQVIIEWVPPGETVQNWSELVTMHIIRNTSRTLTPLKLAEITKEEFKKTCANVTQKIISITTNSALIERTTTSCAPARDEYSIIKIVNGLRSTTLITYASTSQFSKADREKWIKLVDNAQLMNECGQQKL